jgi:hypothetical protein
MNAVQLQQQQAPKASRMKLAQVVKGKVKKPPRVLVFAVEKLGKSTFASRAPNPIFICSEDGTSELDVSRFPEPKTWGEVFDAVDELLTVEHDYKTLVIDTLDWLEPMCWKAVCAKAKVTAIEDMPYGRGYNAALDEWRLLLARLEKLREERWMWIVLLAHSWIKTYKSPDTADYDRHEMKLHAKAGGLIKEWCDAVLFGTYETYTHEKNGKIKGVSTGARILHTQRRAAWDAGNRYDLPETIPLDWDVFADAVTDHRPAEHEYLVDQIKEMLTRVPRPVAEKVGKAMTTAKDDTAELARIANKLSGIINTSTSQQENAQ